jgi:hypothetical protein
MASAMIFSPDDPKGSTPLINAIRRWRGEERFESPEEAHDVLRDLLSRVVDYRQKSIDQMMSDWRKFVRTLRVCCFSEKVDSISAWQNYAGDHKGIAIKFDTGEYSSIKNSIPVSYKPTRPQISTLNDEMSIIIAGEKHVAQNDFQNKFTIRSPLYSSEKEWRCFDSQPEQPGATSSDDAEWFDDKKFERSDVMSVYFGCNTPAQDKKEIYSLLKDKYGQTKIFQSKPSASAYELEFEPIKSSR